MKKVILSVVALMIGSFVMAQVSSDPDAPTVQQATNLSPDPTANAVENAQSGVENYMLVRQEGTSSSVYIDQSEGGVALGNLIYVRQSGDVVDNQALSGQDNRADVRQAGVLNESFVRQEGDFNRAAMVQESGSSDNIGYIRQGTGENAEDNYAGLVQDGSNNSGWIQQTYDNSEALTLQTGTNHQALTNQNANPDNSAGHDAKVEQTGNAQMSYVAQTGSNSAADVFQEGDGNYSDVRQSGTGVNTAEIIQSGEGNKSFAESAGNSQDVFVSQTGDDNKSDINQSGITQNFAAVVQQGNENYANQTQTNNIAGGDANIALINQGDINVAGAFLAPLILETNDILDSFYGTPGEASYSGVAYQTQHGEGNVAEANQFGDDSFLVWGFPVGVSPNTSKQIQTGNDNTASVVQNAFQGSLGTPIPIPEAFTPDGGNSALQVQTGNDNVASVIQRDLGNRSWQTQDGSDSALGVQIGINNDLVTKQYQGANFMETGQAGAEQNIYAAQRGGQSFIGEQLGLFNTMEVLQVGPDMDAWETIDCDIPDPMQPMDLPNMEDLGIPDIDVPGLCHDC